MDDTKSSSSQEALFKIGYGLYILSAKADDKDNACVVNTLLQVTSAKPTLFVIAVNKQNLTHDMIEQTKRFNISVLTTAAPFEIYNRFGYQSGKSADKFSGFSGVLRSKNGLFYLTENTNAFLSFEVTGSADFGSHTLFTAVMTDGGVLGDGESVTYSYYQKLVKPKPEASNKHGFRCKICNYFFEGTKLPQDYICPLCKHGADDFYFSA